MDASTPKKPNGKFSYLTELQQSSVRRVFDTSMAAFDGHDVGDFWEQFDTWYAKEKRHVSKMDMISTQLDIRGVLDFATYLGWYNEDDEPAPEDVTLEA